ncbi:MAG: hypothetical protein PHQ59_03825 [Candidatus Daviesbacteria bacterium]|nr:hypothetical protein [Candidatus Daviesbacteria bacterium]
MEASKLRVERYKDIADEKFRNYLTSFDEFLDDKLNGNPIALESFCRHPYTEQLRLKSKDVSRIVTYCTNSRVLDIQKIPDSLGRERINGFDKENCLAFASIAHVVYLKFSPDSKYPGLKANMNVPWSDIPWKEMVYEAKEKLGSNPLSERIHILDQQPRLENDKDKHTAEQPETNSEYSPRVSIKKKEKIYSNKPKFLRFDEVEIREKLLTADLGLEEIAALYKSIPGNQVDSISTQKHNISPELITAVMFIYHANAHTLEKFDPEETLYFSRDFHKALETSLMILNHYKKLGNDDFTTLEKVFSKLFLIIEKNPDKYTTPTTK